MKDLEQKIQEVGQRLPGVEKELRETSQGTPGFGEYVSRSPSDVVSLEMGDRAFVVSKWEDRSFGDSGGVQVIGYVKVSYESSDGIKSQRFAYETVRDRFYADMDKGHLESYRGVSAEVIDEESFKVSWKGPKGEKGPTDVVRLSRLD
jgi:hypothetical protein